MIIEFDPKRMVAFVRGGIGDEFKPDEKTEVIQKKITALRNKMQEYQDKIINPELEAIDALVKAYNEPIIKKLSETKE